eukprot:15367044-Ditylum_brightwellii.AAC.1
MDDAGSTTILRWRGDAGMPPSKTIECLNPIKWNNNELGACRKDDGDISYVWSKIAHTNRNNHHRSITSLRIPESWPQIGEDINTNTDLENPKKAKTTFWTSKRYTIHDPTLSIKVDWAANSIMSELILEGNYTNKEINAFTSKLLEHCKKEQDSIELGETISIPEWKKN